MTEETPSYQITEDKYCLFDYFRKQTLKGKRISALNEMIGNLLNNKQSFLTTASDHNPDALNEET